jgi:predicted RNA-binding Zn-ribbon protein involved in translation (DUF1610 family)
MDFPATPEALSARLKAFRRESMIVAVVGYTPLLVLYAMTYTSYLRALLPPSKNMQLLYLIVIPGAWAVLLTFTQRRLGLRRHKLACPDCGHKLIDRELKKSIERGACSQCGAPIIAAPPAER